MESGGNKLLQSTSNDEQNMPMSKRVKQEQSLEKSLTQSPGKEWPGNTTLLPSEDGKCNKPIATAHGTDDTEVELFIKIGQKYTKSEEKYKVFGKLNDSVYKTLIKNEAVENAMKEQPEKEMRVSIEGSYNIYVNLGMPLKCLPKSSHLHITFFKNEKNENDRQQYSKSIDQECFTFYISVTGLEKKRIVKLDYGAKKDGYLCVFGTGGDTVYDVLRNDGRFLLWVTDNNWTLIKNDTKYEKTTQVEKVANQEFKVCVKNEKPKAHHKGLEDKKKKMKMTLQQKPHSEKQPDHLDTTQESTQSLSTDDKLLKPEIPEEARELTPAGSKPEQGKVYYFEENILKIYTFFTREYNLIRHFFKIEEEKAKKSGIELFNLHHEKFGKITEDAMTSKSFKILATLGDSVGCIYLDYNGKRMCGTCFVFWDRYILTCRHVLEVILKEVEEQKWAQAISENSFVIFTDENPLESLKRYAIEPWFEVSSVVLDYAVLQLKENDIPKGLFKQKQNTEIPCNGTVCIIGHPEGQMKKIDFCTVIPLAERANTYLTVLQDRQKPECNSTNCPESTDPACIHMFSLNSFKENKQMNFKSCLTYHTSFFSGSSGSPVLDASGRLVALHTGGFLYKYRHQKQSIIEYGSSINSIHEDMVHNHGKWYNLLFPYQQDVEMENIDDSAQSFTFKENVSDAFY